MESELRTQILRARSDPAAFAALMSQYRPLIEGLCDKYRESAARLGADGEDLAQEAAIAFFGAVRAYDTDNDRVTFGLFAKICINRRLLSLLRNRSDAALPFDEAVADASASLPADDPESTVIGRDSYETLFRAIDNALSSFEMDVFKMFLTDRSYAEIAHALGRDEKSVNNAMCRIRAKLAKLLGKGGNPEA